jgi:hypothetical protein
MSSTPLRSPHTGRTHSWWTQESPGRHRQSACLLAGRAWRARLHARASLRAIPPLLLAEWTRELTLDEGFEP